MAAAKTGRRGQGLGATAIGQDQGKACLHRGLHRSRRSATLKAAAEAERLRRAGHKVVDFTAGEPDFPTPEHVKAAGKAAIDANFTRYTAAAGIPELREAICARYKRDYGIDITPAEVLLTAGGKQALFNTALALYDPATKSSRTRRTGRRFRSR